MLCAAMWPTIIHTRDVRLPSYCSETANAMSTSKESWKPCHATGQRRRSSIMGVAWRRWDSGMGVAWRRRDSGMGVAWRRRSSSVGVAWRRRDSGMGVAWKSCNVTSQRHSSMAKAWSGSSRGSSGRGGMRMRNDDVIGNHISSTSVIGIHVISQYDIIASHVHIISYTSHTHTCTHPFNGPSSGTTRVSWYQKGKTNLDFTEERDSE